MEAAMAHARADRFICDVILPALAGLLLTPVLYLLAVLVLSL
jgi:hypothetical protein